MIHLRKDMIMLSIRENFTIWMKQTRKIKIENMKHTKQRGRFLSYRLQKIKVVIILITKIQEIVIL
jgi:hypothetical protein